MSVPTTSSDQWKADCLYWRGKILTGKHAHWCDDWDGLPVDETSQEWPCECYRTGEESQHGQNQ